MVRPRLRPGTYFVPTPDGVCFFTAGRAETFTGRSIYAWVERLAPYLDGRTALADLVSALDPAKRSMVEDIVAALADRDLVVDATDERPHTLTAAELDRYAAQIAFLDAVSGSGAHRFERWHRCRTLAIGSGRTFLGLVTMLADSGVVDLTAVVTAEGKTSAGPGGWRTAAGRPGPQCAMREWPADEAGLVSLCSGVDLAVHVSDHPMAARALVLDRVCRTLHVPLVQGLVVGDEAWLGPVSAVTPQGQDWESGWRRLTDRADSGLRLADGGFSDHSSDQPGQFVAGAAASLAGATVGVIAFRHVTGVETMAGRMTRLDLATLATSSHRFAAHRRSAVQDEREGAPPASGTAQRPTGEEGRATGEEGRSAGEEGRTTGEEGRATGEEGRGAGEAEREAALVDAGSPLLIDSRLGLLTDVGERDFAQLPLNIAAALAHPPGAKPALVTGAGLDFRTARLDAVRKGLELYSWLTAHHLITQGERPCSPISVAHGGAQHVPSGPLTLPAAVPVPASVASGHSWDSAVRDGLIAVCLQLTLQAAEYASTPFPQVEVVAEDVGEDGAVYLELLEMAGTGFSVFDVTGPLGVPCYAFCRGERTVAYVSGPDREAALARGLQAALLDFQAQLNQQPEYAPTVSRPLPGRLRGCPGQRQGGPGPATLTVAELAARLMASGCHPVVLPLDDDPAVAAVLPHVVYVAVSGG
ncbi:MAG TPA: hypothetical protein VGS19_34745 [Streptosporangiaceae bacterium]|nr:hypothetical protein [Streptosporangiaceae bacterium]